MGGAQSTKNLYDCLNLLIQDDIDNRIKEKLKKLNGRSLPKINDSIKEILDFLRKPILSPLPYFECELDCNLISPFQYFVLIPNEKQKGGYFTENFLKNFRLMNFQGLQTYEEDDEQQMMLVFRGLNNYCQMSKALLNLIHDQGLWWQVYVLLWENYWTHLPNLNSVYPFANVNQAFNSKYPKARELRLGFGAETLGAKLWGNSIPIDVRILEQFFLSRDNCIQDLPYSRIFNSILDLWIDQYNISLVGLSTQRLGEVEILIQGIGENSESIYKIAQKEQKHLKNYWEYIMRDYRYLQEVLPEWLVDRLCEILFVNCEERIKQQILQYSEKEQKQLIKEYLQTSTLLESEEILYTNDFSFLINKPQPSILKILVNDLFRYHSILESQKTNITNITSVTENHRQLVLSQIIESNIEEEQVQQQQPQIGEQVTSDFFGSSISKPASTVLYPPLSIKELKDICTQYDQFKFPIVNRCTARDNNVLSRNDKRLKLPDRLHCIFNFTHKTTTQDIVELTTYLSKQQLEYYNQESMADLLFR